MQIRYQIESKSVIKYNPNLVSNTIQIQSKSDIKYNPNTIQIQSKYNPNTIQIRYQTQSKSGIKVSDVVIKHPINTRSTIKKLFIFTQFYWGIFFRETENPNSKKNDFLTKP